MSRLLVSTLLLATTLVHAGSAVAATPDRAPNPDLDKACGLDVLIILDESTSIDMFGATEDVRNAFKAFTEALKNTGSSIAVAEFSREARLPAIGSFAPGDYITITDATKADLDAYVDNDYVPNGKTNWEDGLRMGNPNFAERPDYSVPHLTVFITDGEPTRIIRNSEVTEDEYLNKVPLSGDETKNADDDQAANRAITPANGLKSQGSHILAIAVGNGLDKPESFERLKKISGDDVYDGTGTFDISTDDIYKEPDFSKLQDALREAAFQLCSPSVTVQKLVDETPDPNSVDDAIPGPGWTVEGAVLAPLSPNYDWVLPVSEKPGAGPKVTQTDGAGFATFQWLSHVADASSFRATETIQAGYTNDQSLTECSYRTPDQADQPLPITVGNGTFTATIPPESIVTCRFVNIAVPDPSITVEKATNGADADAPGSGPLIPEGDPVEWTYVVTNTGNVILDPVVVLDDQGVTVDCPKTSLEQNESMTCTATGVSGQLTDGTSFTGEYANLAGVEGYPSTGGPPITDDDPSHYVVSAPGLDIEKSTYGSSASSAPFPGEDADLAPGPYFRVGDPVYWLYVFTNTGTDPLNNITIEDSDVGTVFPNGAGTCTWPGAVGRLAPDQSANCSVSGHTAVAGQYENVATATGIAPTGDAVSDSDPSHYFGVEGSIDIEKATIGEDADTPTGPLVMTGDTVTWAYVVTNTSNVPLTTWTVEDSDPSVTVSCPKVVLRPGRTATCTATGTALPGQYENTGTVTAPHPAGGADLTDSDLSHYYGVDPKLSVEKSTNGEDADLPTGPYIPVGGPVAWEYVVTNDGNVTLTNVTVTDSQGVAISCPQTTLAAGESMTCTASGAATADQYENVATATGIGPLGNEVGQTDPSHYFGANPGINVEKHTNGDDADEAPGPYIPEGDAVTWTYEVTNTGNEPIQDIAVTDSDLGPITCPSAALPVGGSMTCTASGTATLGQYDNLAEVTAQDALGTAVSDDDPSHYFGYVRAISIEKSTNGQDADTETGPLIPAGDPVTWTYEVTNDGNVDISYVTVTDDQGVIPVYQSGDDGDSTLNPGETWVYEATGVSGEYPDGSPTPDQYANIATVDAIDAFEDPVTADDPSHYFVSRPAIDVEKATNGEQADEAPGPRIPAGDALQWQYVVTNTGNVALDPVVVDDDVLGTVSCPQASLGVGESMTCTVSGIATPGQYENEATATGTPPVGADVADTDLSHYFGADPAIDTEKATSASASGPWYTADTPTGPDIPVGDPVYWQYVVTNTGNEPITDVTVTDSDAGVTVDCGGVTTLAVNGSMTCAASGTSGQYADGSPFTGQYSNTGTVTGLVFGEVTVTDVDPSYYFASDPSIDIEKATAPSLTGPWDNADDPTGPFIPVGDAVYWMYTVTNDGNVELTDISVSDDRGVTPVLVPSSDLGGDGILDVGETWVYLAMDTATAGQYENQATASGTPPVGDAVTDQDLSHYFGAAPAIEVEKATNGDDADVETGPYVPVGDTVTWDFVVTNTGNTLLTPITLEDDMLGTISCPDEALDAGDWMTCSVTGTAEAGQHANTGTVTGTPPDDLADVSDEDPSHYYGAETDIHMQKLTNVRDADEPPGRYLLEGDTVTWAYVVFTRGNVPLSNVTVTDDQGVTPVYVAGDRDGDGLLDPDEIWLFRAQGTAQLGQYANIGTATGTPPAGLPDVTDEDPSHYFGIVASIDIQKTPDETYVQSGSPHTFTIAVTNTSDVTLTDVFVTDQLVPACDAELGTLEPGEVVTYDCTVDPVTTPLNNVANVWGTAPGDAVVTDTDDARVAPWNVGGTATIGDTVWQDTNRNGVQDAGEPGIAGAQVTVTYLDGTGTSATYATDANGHYMAVGLVEGNYTVAIDTSSVTGDLTTPTSYTFYLLAGEEHLDADFGVYETLPETGSNTDRTLGLGIALIVLGAVLLVSTWRREEPFEI